jgi:nucleotide-binding universal stress UspA family protein
MSAGAETGGTGIGRIVVGVDGSAPSRAALDWAIRLARLGGCEVIAVYATRAHSRLRVGAAPPAEFDTDRVLRAAFEKEWCKRLVAAGIPHRTVVREGRPASVLAEVAEQVGADLIVVGRRGRGGVAEFVLGSVSHELTLHADRPVLLVSPARGAGERPSAAAAPAVGGWPHQGRERSP